MDSIRATGSFPPPDLLVCTKNLPPLPRRDVPRFARKAVAAIATLGTGNSLGPEGPSVETGMVLSRLITNNLPPPLALFGALDDPGVRGEERARRKVARDRLLLACGAAAGVSAGFNAPLSGVFFALEIVQNALGTIELPTTEGGGRRRQPWDELGPGGVRNTTMALVGDSRNVDADIDDVPFGSTTVSIGGDPLASDQINISAILLASVISALTAQLLLGNELALRLGSFTFNNPLQELPLYLLLGGMSGAVAAIFSGIAQYFKGLFDGDVGPDFVRDVFREMPALVKPVVGSLICGIVGAYVPQVLFFGYETLNSLFVSAEIPTPELFLLLIAKTFTTAVSAACGLVGGTFAPSLFLGGVLGAGFHNIVTDVLHYATSIYPELESYPGISGLPAFAMVGAASVLAALFRAPLTASLLLFECTRNYDVILPLMASAGVASLTGDIVEKLLDEETRESDPVSWGDLATRIYEDEPHPSEEEDEPGIRL